MMNLRTREELDRAVKERERNEGRAEAMIRSLFGEETLKVMQTLKDMIGDRPAITFARQMAKPDIQHNAIYLAAREHGLQLVTLEWLNDLFTAKNYYKRTYVRIPFVNVGRRGTLNFQSVRLADLGKVEGKRLEEITIESERVLSLKRKLGSEMASDVASGIAERDCRLTELHSLLRERVEGPDQIAFNIGRAGEEAANYVIDNKIALPDSRGIARVQSDGGGTVISIGGPPMYLLNFLMHNFISKLALAATDWSKDEPKIQTMYNNTVSYLRSNGLDEPLQTIIPELGENVAVMRHLEGADRANVPIDLVVPTIRVGALEFRNQGPDMGATQVAAATAILQGLKEVRSEIKAHYNENGEW
ncbi:MAG: hypothetical protein KGH58_02570 [Candidatus Micrarchaeota archaeon]|nr:hypothetical protein [Candidatus Micrarchaeota archaeon]